MKTLKKILASNGKPFIMLIAATVMGGFSTLQFEKLMKKDVLQNDIISAKNTSGEQSATDQLVNYPAGIPTEKAIDFTTAAEMTVNAVVHVKTSFFTETYIYNQNPFGWFLGDPGAGGIQKQMQPALSSGSGVIVSADGYIVTNNHVVKGAEKIQVVLNDKKTYDANVVATDPATDLALLKINAKGIHYIPYGNSDDVKVGEWVLAVGNPFNLTSTVTAGIISAKGRSIGIPDVDRSTGINPVESFIQTDAAVNPGNSGGALVNTRGELIGINAAIKSNTGSYTGYSFAIPVNIVKKVVDDLLEYGVVQRAFIGVSIRNIDDEFAKEKSLKVLKGVYITGLTDDGAAKDAGLVEGDVIIKLGNMDITDVPDLQEQLSKFRPGEKVIVTINRSDVEKEVLVSLRNKFGSTELVKKEKENPQLTNILGGSFQEVSADEMRKLRIGNGLKVTTLTGGKLRSAGIKEGFIITRIDKKEINSYEDIVSALENKKGGVLIEGVYPNGMKAYYGFGM